MTDDEIRDKYRRCARPHFSDEQIETSIELISTLETVEDVSTVVDELV